VTAVSLFRPQALAHRRFADQSGVTLPAAPPSAVLVWALFACVTAGLGFAGLRGYAQKERVSGYLAPLTGVVRVMPPRAGLVGDVRVQEGELVTAGEPLVAIRTAALDGSGADVDAAVLSALQAQHDRIEEQVALEQKAADAGRASLSDHVASLTSELESLQATLRLQARRTQIANQAVQSAQALVASGNMSRVEFQQRQDGELSQLQAEIDLARAIAGKQAEITQDRDSSATLPNQTAAHVAALRAQAAEIETRIAEARGSRATLLRAPIAGRISGLQAQAGQLADPAIPLLAIVPQGEALRAELLIPARAIGEIRPGQTVRIAYDAFPVARFGLHAGVVESVSHTLLRPAEIAGPVVPEGPSYRARVRLCSQTIDLPDGALPLAPDMTVSAEIVIDRRSLLGWLLAPLRDQPGSNP
jgi:membrane fusion protein